MLHPAGVDQRSVRFNVLYSVWPRFCTFSMATVCGAGDAGGDVRLREIFQPAKAKINRLRETEPIEFQMTRPIEIQLYESQSRYFPWIGQCCSAQMSWSSPPPPTSTVFPEWYLKHSSKTTGQEWARWVTISRKHVSQLRPGAAGNVHTPHVFCCLFHGTRNTSTH